MNVLYPLLRLLLSQWKWMLLGVVCSAITLLANAALLSLAAWFLACMALAGISGVPFNYHLPAGGIRTLAIVRTLGRYAERLVSHQATFKLLTWLRVWFFRRLEPIAPAGIKDLHSGDIFSRIKSDIDNLDEFYLRFVLPVLSAVLVLSLVFIFVLNFSLAMALHLGLMWALAGAALPLATLHLGSSKGRAQVQSLVLMRTTAIDLARGLEELIVFGQTRNVAKLLLQENRNQALIQTGLMRIEALSESGLILFTGLALWGVLIISIPLVEAGTLSPQNLPMLAVLALLSFEGVQQLPSALKAWGRTRASAERLFSIINQPGVIKEPQTVMPEPDKWDIEFKKVSFVYPGRTVPVHQDLSFRIESGQKVGITGPTGSGKTSLVNLLLKFYVPDQGQIFLGGHELGKYDSWRIRSWIGVVAQDTYLFNATIRENLLLADPEASDRHLYAALGTAKLEDYVRSLPHGLDTLVGQAGTRLSGGQGRRLSIARTLLKKSRILFLDEPTEGLDPATEDELWKTLAEVMQGKTVILINHRQAGLKYMDKVISLKA
ncbi:thiol reductant ABC exporter subunit CydC [Desulfonatronovibrio hydrogenovorans]|uniref:thiol reductant ABC exporter subunit CydC n=1 Tax=Desulfonatronovibrio hydrogenovorans TaxID=53245 RepID=UPI00048F6D34|nr:thiol reductant ABC exporter subunit CydC [Desulfonatronovibrio hydrogenovorans]